MLSSNSGRSSRSRVSGFVLFLFSLLLAFQAQAEHLTGKVLTGHNPLGPGQVTLYRAGSAGEAATVLGTARSKPNGGFRIEYSPLKEDGAVLYLVAVTRPEVKLATVLGRAPYARHVVINERTTVATAYAMAQFIDGGAIAGSSPGLPNASLMLRNLVDITSGKESRVLKKSPNGTQTSAWADFNTLSNMIARCVGNPSDCARLFELAGSSGDGMPEDTLQAMVNIAHNPASNVRALLEYAQGYPLYRPALTSHDPAPDAWTLALRFAGRSNALDGPGLIAFDELGNAWVTNNYPNVKSPERVCGDNRVLAFGPDGAELPGSPFGGDGQDGGLYGAGFGITFDPSGDLWVGNFGFTGSECAINNTQELIELSSSVSQFDGTGQAISPSTPLETPPYGGWRSPKANIYKPQGTVSDSLGNIWLVNCGNDSVTKLVDADIGKAFNFRPLDEKSDPLLARPFGAAIDPDDHLWVASNSNQRIVELDQEGKVRTVLAEDTISFPMGVVSDQNGNIWIANSGVIRPPCGGGPEDLLSGADADAEVARPDASVSVYLRDRKELRSFTGGGIFTPWGLAVDGNNDLWVANFAGPRLGLIGVAHLCGVDSATCQEGQAGKPISPATGYTSNGLERVTGVSIDPSGNVWLVNNWKRDINLENPGGHQLVVLIGLAGPVRTPLIGPPRRP